MRMRSQPTNLHWNELGSLALKVKEAVVPMTLGGLRVVSGGVVSAASARSSVIATNANRASNGANRIRRFLNRAPPLFYRIPQYALFTAKPSR
jgi:hypothetical protein